MTEENTAAETSNTESTEEKSEETQTSSAEEGDKTEKAEEAKEETPAKKEEKEKTPEVKLVDDSFEFGLPDGIDLDKNAVKGFKDFSIENKMSQEQAQAVLDHFINSHLESVKNQQKAIEDAKEKNKEIIKSDPDIGGVNYDKVQLAFDKITLKYGGADFKQKTIEAGLKEDPSFLRFIRNINAVLTEDSTITTSQTTNAQPAERTYQQRAANLIGNF